VSNTPEPTNEPSTSRAVQALREFAARTDLKEVRVTKWHAELLADEPTEVGKLALKFSSAFRYRDAGFDTRFTIEAPLTAQGSEDDLANLQVEVLASFELDGDDKPDKNLLKDFMEQVAFSVVMPFIREGLHTLSSRIGLEPVTLGLLHRGKDRPTSAWTGKHKGHPAGA
jgi:hypothetical protein